MDYKISDVEKSFEGKITENLGNNDYVIKINDKEHQLRILSMDSKGIDSFWINNIIKQNT